MANRKAELVCCEHCGRDTKARDGVCYRCRDGHASSASHDEQVGRKTSGVSFAASPLDDVDLDVCPRAAGKYHGGTGRDDL